MSDQFGNPVRLDRYVGAQIARGNRNLLMWNAAILIGLVAVSWFARVYIYNFIAGPFAADDKSLLELAAKTEHPSLLAYVDAGSRKLIDTGFRQETTVNNRVESTYAYFVTPVADKFLLVLAKSAADGGQLLGPDYRIPDKEQQEIVRQIENDTPAVKGRILPIMLNRTAVFRGAGYVGLAVCLPLFLLALWNISKFISRSVNPHSHPVFNSFSAAGDAGKIAAKIDEQVAEGAVDRFGRVVITPAWLLWQNPFGLTAVSLDDGVWYHLRTISHHGAKSHSIIAHLRNGKAKQVPVRGKFAPAAIQAIAKRVPWALFGYDKQLQTNWQKERAKMINAVDERRRQLKPPT
ncbi:MAG TPA: DUF6709 family protein [Pirellulales bacterium]|nr:DUF6709 family protein [Pirellulales bacterium]